MEAANHPEFKRNIIFLTHFLCSSRSFARSPFSKTTTEPHSDTCKNGPTRGERELWNDLGVAIILASFSKRKSSQRVEFYYQSMGKFPRSFAGKSIAFSWCFLFQGKIPNSSHPKNPTLPPQNFPPETLDEIIMGKPTSKSALSIGTTLGSRDPGGDIIPNLPGIPKPSSGVYLPILIYHKNGPNLREMFSNKIHGVSY